MESVRLRRIPKDENTKELRTASQLRENFGKRKSGYFHYRQHIIAEAIDERTPNQALQSCSQL